MPETPYFIFDGDCVLCSRSVRYVLKHERAATIKFVAIKSDLGREIASEHKNDPDNPRSFLFVDGNQVLTSSDAAHAVLHHAGGPLAWMRVFRFVPHPLRDGAYRLIAKYRYQLFGRLETCMVPAREVRDRFVLD